MTPTMKNKLNAELFTYLAEFMIEIKTRLSESQKVPYWDVYWSKRYLSQLF